MKNIASIAATALLLTSCFSVNSNFKGGNNHVKGEGPVVTKSFDLMDFDSIVINGQADVTFTQGDSFDVTLTTQENIFDYVDYRVEGSTLILETKDKTGIRAERYDVSLQAPSLNCLEVNGAADFDIRKLRTEGDFAVRVNGAGDFSFDQINCRDLTITVNGAADIESSVAVRSIAVKVNGAGDVEVSGKAETASFEVNGAGDIDARNLSVSGQVEKHTSGMAKIQL